MVVFNLQQQILTMKMMKSAWPNSEYSESKTAIQVNANQAEIWKHEKDFKQNFDDKPAEVVFS